MIVLATKGFAVIVTRVEVGLGFDEAKKYALMFRQYGYRTKVVTAEEAQEMACQQQQDLTLLREDGELPPCMVCNQPWQRHYDLNLVKFKLGPHGTFGLTADHMPRIPGVHSHLPNHDG